MFYVKEGNLEGKGWTKLLKYGEKFCKKFK